MLRGRLIFIFLFSFVFPAICDEPPTPHTDEEASGPALRFSESVTNSCPEALLFRYDYFISHHLQDDSTSCHFNTEYDIWACWLEDMSHLLLEKGVTEHRVQNFFSQVSFEIRELHEQKFILAKRMHDLFFSSKKSKQLENSLPHYRKALVAIRKSPHQGKQVSSLIFNAPFELSQPSEILFTEFPDSPNILFFDLEKFSYLASANNYYWMSSVLSEISDLALMTLLSDWFTAHDYLEGKYFDEKPPGFNYYDAFFQENENGKMELDQGFFNFLKIASHLYITIATGNQGLNKIEGSIDYILERTENLLLNAWEEFKSHNVSNAISKLKIKKQEELMEKATKALKAIELEVRLANTLQQSEDPL